MGENIGLVDIFENYNMKESYYFGKKILIDSVTLQRRGNVVFDKIITANQNYIIYSNNNLAGICDLSGNILINCNYSSITPINNFYFIVADSYKNWGLISLYNEMILDFDYSLIKVLDKDFLVVYDKLDYEEVGRCALFTLLGKQLTRFEYDYIEKFTDSLFLAYGSLLSIIDIYGSTIISGYYHHIQLESNFIKVEVREEYGHSEYGLFNRVGKPIVPCKYNFIEVKDKYILVGNGHGGSLELLGIYSLSGECIVPCICSNIEYSIENELFNVTLSHTNIKSQVNFQGEFLITEGSISLRFKNLLFPKLTDSGLIIAAKLVPSYLSNNSCYFGITTISGKIILPFEYKFISQLSNNIFYTQDPIDVFEINRDGYFIRPIYLTLDSLQRCVMYKYGKKDFVSNDFSIIKKNSGNSYKALISNDGRQITDFVMSQIELTRRDFITMMHSKFKWGFYSTIYKSFSKFDYDSVKFNPYTDIDNDKYYKNNVWSKDRPNDISVIVEKRVGQSSIFTRKSLYGACNCYGEEIIPVSHEVVSFQENGLYVEDNGFAFLYSCDGKTCNFIPKDNDDEDDYDAHNIHERDQDDELGYILENGGDWIIG